MAESHSESQPKVIKGEGDLLELTQAGESALSSWVTDVEGDVYAFTSDADPQAVAAAMARLSRNPNDLRTILAGEFMDDQSKDTELLRRVVNRFGDDSVMQLFPMQMVFEGISNIATKEVEWGRLAAYLEQSTRYLRFDSKDAEGKYRYHTPEEFDDETSLLYEEYMNQIFDIYSKLYETMLGHIKSSSTVPEEERDTAWSISCHAQACDTVRALLPAATKATVGMEGSAQAFYNMIIRMNAHELPEIQKLGEKALTQARIIAPVFFERADVPERGGLVTNHQREVRQRIRELARGLLGDIGIEGHELSPVALLSVDGDEDQLVTKILTDSSQLPYGKVHEVVAVLSEEEKKHVIQTYVGERYNRRAKPGRAFEFIHYTFQIECDYGAFRDIQRHRMVDGLEWQNLHTGLGHVVSPAIKEAGVEQEYEQAFRLSEQLYEQLKTRGYEDQAQYATLFGHVMRFTVNVNARALLQSAELRTSPQGHPSYRKIYQMMHEAVAKVHPNVANAMKFVSTAEDQELARLGAERYQQAKFDSSSE